jgi:enoyl-CoA hydratase/carnithine racemase
VSRHSQREEEAAKATRDFTRRAVRRLDMLEWVVLAAAVGLAVGGGAAVALLLAHGSPVAFRATWVVTSLILFIVPGAVVLLRLRREQAERGSSSEPEDLNDG